jgi:hypothetical protein
VRQGQQDHTHTRVRQPPVQTHALRWGRCTEGWLTAGWQSSLDNIRLTAEFKQYGELKANMVCYGFGTNQGCTKAVELWEHGLGGEEKRVPLMRADMTNPERFKKSDCIRECDVCFDGSEPSAFIYKTSRDGKKSFPGIAYLWTKGLSYKDYATYYNRLMIHIRCRTRGSCMHCTSLITA